MEKLELNELRSVNAITLMLILLVIQVVLVISYSFQYRLTYLVTHGGIFEKVVRENVVVFLQDCSEEKFAANNKRQTILIIIYLIANIVSFISFILWFRCAYSNLHIMKKNLRYSTGWATVSWFVPGANLFLPYQIMKELYKETDILLNNKVDSYTHRLSTKFVDLWWILYLICGIGGLLIIMFTPHIVGSYHKLKGITVILLISLIISILFTLSTIKVIKDYSEAEPFLFEIENEDDLK